MYKNEPQHSPIKYRQASHNAFKVISVSDCHEAWMLTFISSHNMNIEGPTII
jgi:hypothetical protein